MSKTYDTSWSNHASDLVELGTPVLIRPRAENWGCHQFPTVVVPAMVGGSPHHLPDPVGLPTVILPNQQA